VFAPLVCVIMRSGYKRNKVEQDKKESGNAVFHSHLDRKEYFDRNVSKGQKVVDLDKSE